MELNRSLKTGLFKTIRLLVGFLFIFSGLIKANDPLGFGYKLQEYFEVFHMGFLNDLSTFIAISICTLEIVLGALLLLGYYIRFVLRGLLFLILFFTFLTFVSAYFKVVTSCGCFGDAIPLTPWQSFIKDIILLAGIVYLYLNESCFVSVKDLFKQKFITIVLSIAAFMLGVFTWSFLPFIDFLPYKIGSNIPKQMEIPVNAKPDLYEITYTLQNKKNGEEKKISDSEYLKSEIWKDADWEIIGVPTKKLIKKGFVQKIGDLIITDASGTNYTKEILESPFYTFVIVAYNLEDANERALGNLNALALNLVDQYHVKTILLTSTPSEKALTIASRLKFFPEIFYADPVPLKSMVRANLGILLLKDGVVIDKWHSNNILSFAQLSEKYLNK